MPTSSCEQLLNDHSNFKKITSHDESRQFFCRVACIALHLLLQLRGDIERTGVEKAHAINYNEAITPPKIYQAELGRAKKKDGSHWAAGACSFVMASCQGTPLMISLTPMLGVLLSPQGFRLPI